jgi:ribosomal protein L6P/L9E
MVYNFPYSLSLTSTSKLISIKGLLGETFIPFFGTGLIFLSNSKLFFLNKATLFALLNHLRSLKNSLEFGFFLELSLNGLGFRLIKIGSLLVLKLGFAHYIKISIPNYLYLMGYKKRIVIFGLYSNDVKEFARKITLFRKADIYKGKGIQVVGQSFRLKPGKQK